MRPLGVELAVMLADRGVDTVFGIPGVHNIELYRGIEQAGIRHILARHEQGAGFMADGYARATGRPGVCFVISGPGLTNIMTPMGQAYSDSVPMLVISTCLDETAARRGQLHQMRDQEGAARTVCDWSETARTPEAAYRLVDRAMVEFSMSRHRPKSISVPLQVLGADADVPPSASGPMRPTERPDVTEAVELLLKAKRPLFIVGGGARHADVDGLVGYLGAAAFATYAGRGVIRPNWSCYFGSYLGRKTSEAIVEKADLMVAIGSELAEVDLWREELGTVRQMIRIDADPVVLASSPPASVLVCCDSKVAVDRILSELADLADPLDKDWIVDEIAAQRDRWKAEVDAERPGIVPVCDALSAALPKNTMIFSDMTQFAYAAKEVWDMPAPGLWHHPTGFGTLGYALPAAIGGAVGYDGPVLAVAGDYGLQYTINELGTAAELGLSLPILLWDNNALGEIRDNMVEAQIAPVAVHLENPEWRHLAAAYRCGFEEPGSIEELCAAINAGFSAGRPTLIRATPALAG